MSEEEIINVLKNHAQYTNAKVINANTKKEYKVNAAIQGLLDLYNKEKEKNKNIANDIENYKAEAYMLGIKNEHEAMKGVIERHYISKDKIREKVIKVKNRTVKDDFITATQGKLNTIIDLEDLLGG